MFISQSLTNSIRLGRGVKTWYSILQLVMEQAWMKEEALMLGLERASTWTISDWS